MVSSYNGADAESFREEIWPDMMTLVNIKAWDLVPRTVDMKLLPTTWYFRIKRFPSGLVRKRKARSCVRGNLQQQGIDVFETYAFVVS